MIDARFRIAGYADDGAVPDGSPEIRPAFAGASIALKGVIDD